MNLKYLPVKRCFDIVISIIGIIICLILLWWWVILINTFFTKGKPFFTPLRIGKNKKVFKMIKFRSMKIDAPIIPPYSITKEQLKSMETLFGKFLRVTSIDETPQLINVLFGQMSIIGPRPGAAIHEELLIQARDKFNPSPYLVKPGITGLAQVKMKRKHDVKTKAAYDSKYVEKMSFCLDTYIFFKTFTRLKGN